MTIQNELLIREATEEDIPAIVELFSICLRHEGGSPTEAFWRWKHFKNPFGKSPVLLAFNKRQLVGLRAFMQWQWQRDGAILPAFRAVDTATHPDFQGRGIFRKLTTRLWHQIQQEIPGSFVYNTPNDKSRPGYLKMGWQVLGKPAAEFYYVAGLGLNRYKQWQKAVDTLADLRFEDFSIDNCIEKGSLIRTHTSGTYYAWRYQMVPDKQYGFKQYELGNGIAGFIFYLRKRLGFTELRICDELSIGDEINADRLLNEGVALLAKEFAGCIVTRLCHASKKGSRLLHQFIPNLTIRLPEDATKIPEGLNELYSWQFEMGALELF